MRIRSIRLTLAAAAAALLTAGAVAPAQAMTPMPGQPCDITMSGKVMTVNGKTYICQNLGQASPRWTKGYANTKSDLVLLRGWAKASTKGGMTGVFGTLKNPSNKPITVIGAASPVAGMVQVHEMAKKPDGTMVMQEIAGGLTIPAKGSVELKPGGNHLMFMNLNRDVTAGSMVPMTIIASDGSRIRVRVMAKTYTGANETYSPNTGDSTSMGNMG